MEGCSAFTSSALSPANEPALATGVTTPQTAQSAATNNRYAGVSDTQSCRYRHPGTPVGRCRPLAAGVETRDRQVVDLGCDLYGVSFRRHNGVELQFWVTTSFKRSLDRFVSASWVSSSMMHTARQRAALHVRCWSCPPYGRYRPGRRKEKPGLVRNPQRLPACPLGSSAFISGLDSERDAASVSPFRCFAARRDEAIDFRT